MTNVVADNLRAARDLIARPNGWTQGAFSRQAKGRRGTQSVEYIRQDHICFCPWGAIIASGGRQYGYEARLLAKVVADSAIDFIPDWNDKKSRKQAEVVQAFDCAIALAEAESA